MGHDTRFHLDLLNRHLALDYLDDDFFNRLSLPDHLKLFGEDTQYMYDSISTAVTQASQGGATSLLTILSGDVAEWDLGSSGLKRSIVRWAEQFQEVKIGITTDDVTSLDSSIREDLWLYTQLGAIVGRVTEPRKVIVQTSSDKSVMTIGSSATTTAIPNDSFWHASNQVLVRSNEESSVDRFTLIDSNSLRDSPILGDQEVEITRELNGGLSQFGSKFWRFLADQSDLISKKLSDDDQLVELVYSDRYLYSPWAVMLITEVLSHLKRSLDAKWNIDAVLVATGDKAGDSRSPSRGYFSNWDDTQRRLEVTRIYLSKFNVIANPIALNGTNLPHGRILELKWSSGEVTTIRLDQGVGYWRFAKDGRLGFLDHSDSADRQSSEMATAIRHLGVSGQDFPTQLFIKHRS